jgi:RimJ/RimL family protein N-acetyltransferase
MIILETERLLFRDHEPEDLDPFCAMEADAEGRRYVGGQPRTRADAERKFRNVYLPAVRNRLGMWATIMKSERRYIGYCGIYPHFSGAGPIPGEGTLGFYLARLYWRQGLATETGRAFIEFGFNELQLKRVVSAVEVGNDASIHVLEKLGFLWVGLEEGERRSFHHFELRRPQ